MYLRAPAWFLESRSTVSNLTCLTDFILCNVDGSGQIDVVYTNFQKTFDRGDHDILLYNLSVFDIHGNSYSFDFVDISSEIVLFSTLIFATLSL